MKWRFTAARASISSCGPALKLFGFIDPLRTRVVEKMSRRELSVELGQRARCGHDRGTSSQHARGGRAIVPQTTGTDEP
jgi:hypothetical protein